MAKTVVLFAAIQPGSHWAHAINTFKLADGFFKAGCKVHLVTRPGLEGTRSIDDLHRIYGISRSVNWHPIRFRTFGIPFQKIQKYFAKKACHVISSLKPDLVYGRDYYVPTMCAEALIPSVAESHAAVGYSSPEFRYMTNGTTSEHFKALTTIGRSLADYYQNCGVPKEKLIVLPDAVDLELFTRDKKKASESPYTKNEGIVLYAGHLYDYKGIPTVLEAAKQLPHLSFHLLGGRTEDIERHQNAITADNLNNVVIHGLVPHTEVPRYLWHADVLLLPPSSKHPSAEWTSPVKLAEYLASGTPTIASDIPALKHWLSKKEVCFFEADNATDLAQKISTVTADSNYANQIADAGYEMATKLTYKRKAERLLAFAFCKP